MKCIIPNFFEELAELMKKYGIKSISPFCSSKGEKYHHIKIRDDGAIEAIGMKLK
jgi:hypothetical protein